MWANLPISLQISFKLSHICSYLVSVRIVAKNSFIMKIYCSCSDSNSQWMYDVWKSTNLLGHFTPLIGVGLHYLCIYYFNFCPESHTFCVEGGTNILVPPIDCIGCWLTHCIPSTSNIPHSNQDQATLLLLFVSD